ncbi:IS30 family transposase [Arcanobacterium pluranimalium]|nr:IS30 family transposase [Arcanobacterium pluranimalium]MBM7825793.1 IS30 family transposase [Arcanobacterium pluranimalium]
MLNMRYSPRQIQNRLRFLYPLDEDKHVSGETIYQAIYIQGRGSLRQELRVDKALRSGRTKRIAVSKLPARKDRPCLDGHHISSRPAQAGDRAVPGHWEGDLVIGKNHKSALITLVERTTRFTMVQKVKGFHDTTTI